MLNIEGVKSFATVGALIVFSAPGNAVRASVLRHQGIPEPEFLASILPSLQWVIKTYSTFFLLTTTLFVAALLLFFPSSSDQQQANIPRYVWVPFFAALWASAFTRFYSIAGISAGRVRTVDYAITTFLCLLVALELHKRLVKITQSRQLSQAWLIVLTLGAATALFSRPVQDKLRFSSVFHDIQAEINLNRYMVHRFRKLPTDGQFVDVSYPDVKRDAITFFDDITPDSNDWKNKCFASYFKLDKVTLVANH